MRPSSRWESLDWRAIADAQWLRAEGLFVAEGRRVVSRVLRDEPSGGFEVVRVLATAPAVVALGLGDRLRDRVDLRSPAEMEAVTGFNFHRGIVALVRRPPALPLARFIAGLDRRLPLVLGEHLADVDNVGSVFRNARALGAAGVLLDETSADPLYRKAVRTSTGAVLDVPWAVSPKQAIWPAVRDAGYRMVALTPADDAGALRDVLDATTGQPDALLVGNEGTGLSEEALTAADVRARIPMTPGADSLNVATALAVALYEAATRRG